MLDEKGMMFTLVAIIAVAEAEAECSKRTALLRDVKICASCSKAGQIGHDK
jgi:hypothetical protein